VGLSFFAALFSTISYLAWPGEMIKHGPMILSIVAAYPLVAVVVGWFMIPYIMKLRITSAYEILETRLGLSVRMLGSALFLLLRLLWMAVIIYATVTKVLVPLLALDPSSTPYICVVMGVVPLIYTAMGGLKAGVVIDVLKSVVLFAGAIITIVAITVALGGVGAWWPTSWPTHWPEPNFGYDPNARVTFWGAATAMFVWYICTAGSDQVAIQRYLATRDAKAARRVLNTSLVTTSAVLLLLATLGLALLAYFQANPHQLPDGQRIVDNADQLFTRFIVVGLPPGLSGLVVAGLLAAAMSSLSAGISSSCSVVTVDFLDRFRRAAAQSENRQVEMAKYISVVIGALVVVLSTLVGVVHGNLLEIAYKVVNPLAAPLFGLFFMAMFVPWATSFGTLIGAAGGIAVVGAVNYWEEITGTKGISFLWAMPLALVSQIVLGSLASLLPIGSPRPQPASEE
jgi:SSS family solute:Na+ symporter